MIDDQLEEQYGVYFRKNRKTEKVNQRKLLDIVDKACEADIIDPEVPRNDRFGNEMKQVPEVKYSSG